MKVKLIAFLGRTFSFVIIHLPRPIRYFLGDFLGFLWFDLLRIRRQIVLDNLKRAFPQWTERERLKVARRSCYNMGRGIIEYCHLPFIKKSEVDDIFEFRNLQALDAALAKGKGVCMLTLHLGNGDYAIAGYGLKGYKMTLISKLFKIKWLNDLWFGMRARLGTKFIPPRDSSFAVIKALKRNEIVIFVNDQFMGPPVGVKTTFFGVETGTAAGVSVIAKRTGAPVIPCYTFRDENGKTVVQVEEEVDLSGEFAQEDYETAATQKMNYLLEQYITRHPDQWMWIHRRFKQHIVR